MSEFDTRTYVEDALGDLIDGLSPFVAARFDDITPGVAWTDVLRRKDRQAGRESARYNPRDLSLLLRTMTEGFGTLGYPFAGILNRQATNCASELRNVRNKWAHNEQFTVAETYRALDSAEILLLAAHADAPAERVRQRKREVLEAMTAQAGAEVVAVVDQSSTDSTPAPPNSSTPAAAAPVATPPDLTASITVSALPDLSYAHARNDIAVVDEIVIHYEGPEQRGASVEVEAICELGSLGDPKVVIVDLDGASPTTLRNADLVLDPARMLAVEYPMPGSVRVTLRRADGSAIAATDTEVTVLAANQWRANPPQLSLEMLAAFVQPNSPAISPLLLEASDRLQASTGQSSLDAYQQGSRERVDDIVEAIYESMRARDIRYAEPPASWGLEGQKVRTPAEVLEGRIGTCLDTTLTLAAVLEEAGINSTLWLVSGHIFLGYWRDDASLDGPAQADAAEVMNYVGIGQLEVLETTLLTGGTGSKPFSDARRQPHNTWLASGAGSILGVTDVKQARLAHIYPLPSRTVSDSGEVTVSEYDVAATPDALRYEPSAEAIAGGTARAIPPRVTQWKNALLDLSLRNRLINYGDKAGYPLAVPQPSLPVFEDMINSGATITLVANDRISTIAGQRGNVSGSALPEVERAGMLSERKSVFVGLSEATYTTRLRALAYKARTIIEETGANNLYLAFGMLRWTFNDRELRSPLVLVPVTLEASGGGKVFRLRLDEAGESTPNYCLLEKLRVSFGLDIPGLANPAKDDAGIDLPAAFTATRRALAAARLSFTVEDTVDLSILQFAKFRLWKDLDENWDELSGNSLVNHLIHTPTAEYEDPFSAPVDVDLDALGNAVPVAADSSQLEAVVEAEAKRTFVLEGPPGTGKSQTITNLLAHSLANGKRVLFVAEKRAALDVVKTRLDAVGLGPFSLDLHDKGARPNAVRAQIRAAIDALARPDGASLNANVEAATSSRGSLQRYALRLHEPNSAGLSLYTARAQLLASAEEIEPLPVPAALVTNGAAEQFAHVRELLRQLPETADLAHPSRLHPWGFVPATSTTVDNTSRIHHAAQDFDSALAGVLACQTDTDLLALIAAPVELDQWAILATAPRYPLDAIDSLHAPVAAGEISALQGRLQAIGAEPSWFVSVGPEALDQDVSAIHEAAVSADASRFFGRRKRQRAVLGAFGTALRVNAQTFPPREVTPLSAQVSRTAAEIVSLRAALTALPIPPVGTHWNPYLREGTGPAANTLGWAVWLDGALDPGNHDVPLRATLRHFYGASAPDPSLGAALKQLAGAWRSLASALGLAEPTGHRTDVFSTWAAPDNVFSVWQATSRERNLLTAGPVTLDRWVAFSRHLEPLVALGMQEAHDALLTGEISADLAALSFDKGIAVASIAERSDAQALAAFDVQAHNRTIERYTTSAAAIRDELPRWIPAEIITKRRINPAYEGGMMGELKRQLARQRGGMSVRALFESYGDLITQIAPCVLMSPESVSRFFPAKAGMFDIVVFDEASQIRVADAVGAMGRGASVVVVGDSKQMPPSSFAEISNDVESDAGAGADVVADEESILTESVQARVPRKWLSWHYRSQDEALISFSNHAYYDSRLSSFPAPWPRAEYSADAGHGVSLVRVDGQFNRSGRGRDLRTNPVEAAAIVTEVSRRFAASPNTTPSLGIITFNAPQRTLVETLLREVPDERVAHALDERDGLFVKNLENVQGDERDVILFSVAFSANERGVIPLNFGPLSRAGGERRLNVAITRARRQVILFASFDPADLRAEQTAAAGIKHLKGYLELAASGVESATDNLHRERTIDRHRDEIANELRDLGLAVETDVGLSDFRVDISIAAADNPGQPLVAVLLDGEGWRARRTVADRDGLPVDVLKGLMHWPGVERVWLPEWLQQREETLRRLTSAVAEASTLVRDGAGGVDAPEAAAPSNVVGDQRTAPVQEVPNLEDPRVALHIPGLPSAPSATTKPPQASPPDPADLRHAHLRQYIEWQPKRFGSIDTLDRLPQGTATARVAAALREVIETEGPIHKVRLVRLVAESFGLNRVAVARSNAILRCLPAEYSRATDKSCAWPTGIDPAEWHEVRRSQPGLSRNIDQVPLEEIANAMAVVSEVAGGMNKDELKRQALALFGGKRLTEGVAARLDEGMRRGLDSGRLTQDRRGLFQAAHGI